MDLKVFYAAASNAGYLNRAATREGSKLKIPMMIIYLKY